MNLHFYSLSLNKNQYSLEGNYLVVYSPADRQEGLCFSSKPYVYVKLDVRIDIDRSTLTIQEGNYLAARLPFTDMSSSGKYGSIVAPLLMQS